MWKRGVLSRGENTYRGFVEITHVAGSNNKKMTSVCQEQTEHSGGTENEIREEAP